MNRRLARTITALYPASWRARYGDEFVALLQALPPTPATIADASFRALALRLRGAALAFAITACVALPVAADVHHHAVAVSAHTYTALPAASACRSYSSTSKTGFVQQRRCLD